MCKRLLALPPIRSEVFFVGATANRENHVVEIRLPGCGAHRSAQDRQEYPSVEHLLPVGFEKNRRKTEDGIDILPYTDFIHLLWQGEWNEIVS
jgi:hypothetical protein